MSLEIKLNNANLISYARTEDAHEAFINSVNNGQTRLALEVLAELIDGIMETLSSLVESDENLVPITERPMTLAPADATEMSEPVIVAESDKPKPAKAKVDKESALEV